jgi:hypothetical protein
MVQTKEQISFPAIGEMPDIPPLGMPDYISLSRKFREAVLDPAGGVMHRDEKGNPVFTAYLEGRGSEMVTWGILTVGEWLLGNDTGWITPAYSTFFDQGPGIYLNTPGNRRIEYWYLFYANLLAGAVFRTSFPDSAEAARRMGAAADCMFRMAREVRLDFNGQGFNFDEGRSFTDRDAFRQPDSAAGYAYAMLFAARNAGKPSYLDESRRAMERYESFPSNPWYEIPNVSAGVLAACWLNAHGFETDVEKVAGYAFDHEEGPLQTGFWGTEAVDGLMMGWRGETRRSALDSAYSMETLMPMQLLLPSVRYCPRLADSVAKYLLNALTSFRLFYARGREPLYETRPDLNAAVPYEKLERERDGHTPAACGDFWGHRSVYGAGYLAWAAALAVRTNDRNIPAFDLSLTDWLAQGAYPVYLLRNPCGRTAEVRFSPGPAWRKKVPALYQDGRLCADVWDLKKQKKICGRAEEAAATLCGGETAILAVLPAGLEPDAGGSMVLAGGTELCALT